MDESRAQALLIEAKKRFAHRLEKELADDSFPEQAAFVRDTGTFVGAQCTRRAGKSNGIGFRLYRKAKKYPKSMIPYIALTRESAHNIMWPVFHEINDRYRIGATLTDSNLTVTLPNEARIVCFGADMKNFIQRLRGIKTPEAAVDEGQSFGGHLQELVDDILTPAVSDYEDGAITLTGTPGPVPAGYFYEACTGKQGFDFHKWSVYQNPYMPRARTFVDELKRKKGWTDDNPTYKREWCNEWVLDDDIRVYKFHAERNSYDVLPAGHVWHRILVIDYGWNDQTAFGVTTYSATHPHSFTEWVEGKSGMIPSRIAERIMELRSHFDPYIILADTGGLGKSITEEMIQRYAIPIQAAEKTEKLTAIHLMNGDFIDQRHFIQKDLKRLQDQYNGLVKAENHLEDPSLPNDLCDVGLYGHREARNYLSKLIQPKPALLTPEWFHSEAERMEEHDLKELETDEETPWWAK